MTDYTKKAIKKMLEKQNTQNKKIRVKIGNILIYRDEKYFLRLNQNEWEILKWVIENQIDITDNSIKELSKEEK